MGSFVVVLQFFFYILGEKTQTNNFKYMYCNLIYEKQTHSSKLSGSFIGFYTAFQNNFKIIIMSSNTVLEELNTY